MCGIQEHLRGQPWVPLPGLELALLPWAPSGLGTQEMGVRPQAKRSVLGLPEGSSLQWAEPVPQLTVSYLWF